MESCVSLRRINCSFGKKQILREIDLEVPCGAIYGLLGPSGGGKTTMVKIMTGVVKASGGEIYVLGERMPSLALLRRIGYMTQSDALYPALSAEENLRFFASLYGMKRRKQMERIGAVLDLVGLAEERKKEVRNFSGGMKRRLSLAAALLHEPEVLLLDEPTVGIDPLLRKEIWNRFREIVSGGTTILITTHVMDEAEKCDRLAMLRDGRIIAEGTPGELTSGSGTEGIEEAFLYYGRAEPGCIKEAGTLENAHSFKEVNGPGSGSQGGEQR